MSVYRFWASKELYLLVVNIICEFNFTTCKFISRVVSYAYNYLDLDFSFTTVQKMKFSITDFFSKCDQISSVNCGVLCSALERIFKTKFNY